MRLLHDLALLYLAMAETTDEALSNAELDAVTESLHRHFDALDRAEVQNLVLEALTAHLDRDALRTAAHRVVHSLAEGLSAGQKAAVLDDLDRVARADGLILDAERDLLAAIAEAWHVAAPAAAPAPEAPAADPDGALHHLAFLYLVLAHGTDLDLSEDERLLMLRKLQEWRPSLAEPQVRAVLERAMERYAHGASPYRLAASVEAVRDGFPEAQRQAAFDDLVALANADGVFLDSEEDLLNDLRTAWHLPAHAGFGEKGGGKQETGDGENPQSPTPGS